MGNYVRPFNYDEVTPASELYVWVRTQKLWTSTVEYTAWIEALREIGDGAVRVTRGHTSGACFDLVDRGLATPDEIKAVYALIFSKYLEG
jgi:hypothetical protein